MTRSMMVVGIGTGALFVLQLLAESNAKAFTNVPWAISLVLLGVFLAALGGVVYRFLRGSVFGRLVLIAAMVVIANGAAQVVVGSDQAYPDLRLWLIIPYVALCWLGATIAIGLTKWGPRNASNAKR